eukprot:SAG11_NODE_1823_length_4206_cov_11.545654_5_plen_70_part_00
MLDTPSGYLCSTYYIVHMHSMYVACTRPDPTRTVKISYRVQSGGVSHINIVRYRVPGSWLLVPGYLLRA